jgi:minor extracellular serine protease Vpr
MPTRRLLELALAAGAVALAVALIPGSHAPQAAEPAPPVSWQGLVGDGPRATVHIGQQMIVVLKTPSLAERVAANGGVASTKQEQRWTRAVTSQIRLLRSRLEVQGVTIHPELLFSHVLSGFSAALDASAVSLLERDDAVQGVYPVRVAYPASVSSTALERAPLAKTVGNADLSLAQYDGRAVTIALLDTGVDRHHASLLGSVDPGIDVVDPKGDATPQAPPSRPLDVERHGTEMAGILVGDHGPPAANGIARGATVLPIRIAGWQPDGSGGYAVYSRTDQLIEGLERAVDPNADGDAHDAARVALVGVAAPFAGFADDPAARAVAGALALDTLVVVPAGNDGPAGPAFGSISGPGGSPDALTVGAADTRAETQDVRVSIRSGLHVVLDRMLPLTGALAPRHALTSAIVAPGLVHRHAALTRVDSYFDEKGLSLVAGRAALVPGGSSPAETARSAARAGATAVLLYGPTLPAGSVPLDEDTPVPVMSVSAPVGAQLLAAIARGRNAALSLGTAHTVPNETSPAVAAFSSTGLAYDGRVKPDVVAPGVAVATTEPSADPEEGPRYGTVNGTSAAAATVAGAAAVLVQARPDLHAADLRSVLVTSARRLPAESVSSAGAGFVSLPAAAAAELAVEPTTLAFGNVSAPVWSQQETVAIRNISSRPVFVRMRSQPTAQGAAPVSFDIVPSRFELPIGAARNIRIVARVTAAAIGTSPAEGNLVVAPLAGAPLHLPWAVTFTQPPASVLGPLSLSTNSFTPSDAGPALLTFQAGRLGVEVGRDTIEPVSLLRLELFDSHGTDLGTLATLRDLLPGRYAFGLTGRTPAGNSLAPGVYRLRVTAIPSLAGPVSRENVHFTIK